MENATGWRVDRAGDFTLEDNHRAVKFNFRVGKRHGGKYCLRLDPPLAGEKFTCAFPVHSVFKSNTRYHVSVWIKAGGKDGVWANIAGQEIGKGQTSAEWKQFAADITTGPGTTGLYRTLYNLSSAPACFDDLTVREAE